MQCTNPVLIKARNPILGDRKSFGLFVPCGKCVACRIARAREWSTRMLHELNYHDAAGFFTLTYRDDDLPFMSIEDWSLFINEPNEVVRRECFARNSTLVKRDLQLFFKRLRKSLGDLPIKYYACGEYGEKNGRAHYHAIIYGIDDRALDVVSNAWSHGDVHCGSVTYDSCRYVADYVGKSYSGPMALEVYGDRERPFQLQSRGIGRKYAEDNALQLYDNLGVTIHGTNVGLPRYYRKVLEIGTYVIAPKALESEAKLAKHYEKRGVVSEAELANAVYKARKQAKLNQEARSKLYNRDKF